MRVPVLLALLTAPLGAQSFEGAITMNMSGDGGRSTSMTYMVKGDKIRMEMGGGMPVAMIYDVPAQKMLMVMTAQRMYMEQDLAAAAAAAGQASAKSPTVTHTGKTETVAGYSCEHILVTDDKGKTVDVCMAKDLKAQFRMPSAGNSMMGRPTAQPAWVSGVGGFALKVQEGDRVLVEVTKVEKKSLDGSLFSAPDGFQKMDMNTMRRP